MIHLAGKFWFVHIPRTGGTSVATILKEHFPDAIVDHGDLKHDNAAHSALSQPEQWNATPLRLATIRSPWDIIESDYRFACLELINRPRDAILYTPQAWRDKLARLESYRAFSDWVKSEHLGAHAWARPGGFWRTWCLAPDGSDLGVKPLRLDAPENWATIARCLGIAGPLPQLNAAPGPRPRWTADTIDAIADRCHEDIARFQWRPPRPEA